MLVCTDAAARGIDIPNVTHVVQSSFAASAVDFLHRVGTSPYCTSFFCCAPRAMQSGKLVLYFFQRKHVFAGSLRQGLLDAASGRQDWEGG